MEPRLIQEGPRDARLVLVGEAPGKNEAASGIPFVGASGGLVNEFLEGIGVLRREVFITNVAHEQPPGNDFAWFYTTAGWEAYQAGIAQLKRDLLEIRPNLVVALGGEALRALTGKRGISDWRGSLLRSWPGFGSIKTLSTYHPAATFRVYDYKAIITFDFERVKQEYGHPELHLPRREYFLDPEPGLRDRIIAELLAAPELSIDIECTMERRLICVGFTDHAGRALVLPATSPRDLLDIKRLCEAPMPKIMQNGTFDSMVLLEAGVVVANFAWDTMLAHHALYPECAGGQDETKTHAKKRVISAFAKGLDFQASIYTREPFWKHAAKSWAETGDLQEFYLYNGKDTAVTKEIKDVQGPELDAFGTRGIFLRSMRQVAPCMSATLHGLPVDFGALDELRGQVDTEILEAQNALDALVGESVNVKSNPQIAGLLFGKRGLRPTKISEKTQAPSVDADVLIELSIKYDDPVLNAILHVREKRDLKEKYLNAPIDRDGRFRCGWDLTGTRTGRLSSRQSIYGSGGNLQNQPPRLKRMFRALPGYVFVGRDYSQAEARAVAYMARCRSLIALFEDPTRDIHRENASRIYRLDLAGVTDTQRSLAKAGGFLSNYGGGPPRLAATVNARYEETGIKVTSDQMRVVQEGYFLTYPEIKSNYWREVEHELRRDLTLTTPQPFGRRRTFYGRWSEQFLREGYSFKPQSLVGDICREACARCYYEIEIAQPALGAVWLVNVHDYVMMMCREEHAETVAREMARCMEIEWTVWGYRIVLPSDCKIGRNWGEHSATNPDGMRKVKI